MEVVLKNVVLISPEKLRQEKHIVIIKLAYAKKTPAAAEAQMLAMLGTHGLKEPSCYS